MRRIVYHAGSGWPSPITVVSGLPRSGTSLIMQMLQAGGAKLLADDVRQPDAHNPNGYYEFDPVKRLRDDASWLPLAQGKVIKIISHFLEYLPDSYRYNVIFLRRDLGEILASQRAMLESYGEGKAPIPDSEMKFLFQKHLAHVESFLHSKPCFKILYLDHRDIINEPHDTAVDIDYFLCGGMDVGAMARAVNPELYRNRA